MKSEQRGKHAEFSRAQNYSNLTGNLVPVILAVHLLRVEHERLSAVARKVLRQSTRQLLRRARLRAVQNEHLQMRIVMDLVV